MKIIKTIAAAGLMASALIGAQAQTMPTAQFATRYTNVLSATNCTVITNRQTLTVNSGAFPIYRDRGFSFQSTFVTAGSTTTTNATYTFDFTDDGTNWSTTHPVAAAFTFNGTTGAVGWTNLAKANVDNAKWGRLAQIINGDTNSINITNALVGAVQ